MSKSSPLTPPRIGPHTVFGRIADCRRSVVWAATSRQFGGFVKSVAIKCMKPAAALVSDERRAFMFEATIGGALDHPNVASVFDVGVWQGRPFIVMELVRGWTLRSILATAELTRMPIPLPAALSIAHTAAEGLHALHQLPGRDGRPLGLVHRAVDDNNILVARAGYAKLIDFGLTVPSAVERPKPLARVNPPGTRAPELEASDTIDCRADVYALGKLLQRLCDRTHLPFSDDLRAVVARAAATKPHNRFDNARDFQRSLEAVAAARDLTITSAAPARFLEQLYSPTQRPAPGRSLVSLPGLDQARRTPRKPTANGGRTRVRVTRDRSAVTAMRAIVLRRRASTGL